MVQNEIAPSIERSESRVSALLPDRKNPGEYLALVQGIYYLATGLWPIVSSRTFMMITGRKTDVWLVKTVGVLAAVIGAVLESGGRRQKITRELHLLGIGSAAGFALIDMVYVLKRRISPVYLLDALAEIGLVAGWIAAWMRRSA